MAQNYWPASVKVRPLNTEAIMKPARQLAKEKVNTSALVLRRDLIQLISEDIHDDTGTMRESFYVVKSDGVSDYDERLSEARESYTSGNSRYKDFWKLRLVGAYTEDHFEARILDEVEVPSQIRNTIRAAVASFWLPVGFWDKGFHNKIFSKADGGDVYIYENAPIFGTAAILFRPILINRIFKTFGRELKARIHK